MTNIDPIIEQAIADLAQRDEISPALATIGLVNYAVTHMVNCAGADNTRDWCIGLVNYAVTHMANCAGADNTRDWCTAVIDSATHNQEAA